MPEEKRTIGYICPVCGQAVIASRTAFQLAAGDSTLPCPCGKSELAFRQLYQETSHQWSGQGWNTGNGTWLFPVQTPLTAYGEYWWRGGGYTLALYRADGALLLEKSGTLGE